MPMHPRPSSDTTSPCVPSRLRFILDARGRSGNAAPRQWSAVLLGGEPAFARARDAERVEPVDERAPRDAEKAGRHHLVAARVRQGLDDPVAFLARELAPQVVL